ncbi:hypothetical protein H5410_020785 [Solanum commersonii]|uniref:Uncharacterized protein n=1 Tax=Solanum commersonii TaxID=4109 RepID=A0A9J5ZCB1_SOLCO|nr:hypothetical protein H5410_020785 [Solanum commersonii]
MVKNVTHQSFILKYDSLQMIVIHPPTVIVQIKFIDSLSPLDKSMSLPNERIEKLKMMLERIMLFLRLNKHDINLVHKERLFSVEKHISFFQSCKYLHKPTSSPLQGYISFEPREQDTYARQLFMLDSCGRDIASEFDRLLHNDLLQFTRKLLIISCTLYPSQEQDTYARQLPMLDSCGRDIASEFDRLLCLID